MTVFSLESVMNLEHTWKQFWLLPAPNSLITALQTENKNNLKRVP